MVTQSFTFFLLSFILFFLPPIGHAEIASKEVLEATRREALTRIKILENYAELIKIIEDKQVSIEPDPSKDSRKDLTMKMNHLFRSRPLDQFKSDTLCSQFQKYNWQLEHSLTDSLSRLRMFEEAHDDTIAFFFKIRTQMSIWLLRSLSNSFHNGFEGGDTLDGELIQCQFASRIQWIDYFNQRNQILDSLEKMYFGQRSIEEDKQDLLNARLTSSKLKTRVSIGNGLLTAAGMISAIKVLKLFSGPMLQSQLLVQSPRLLNLIQGGIMVGGSIAFGYGPAKDLLNSFENSSDSMPMTYTQLMETQIKMAQIITINSPNSTLTDLYIESSQQNYNKLITLTNRVNEVHKIATAKFASHEIAIEHYRQKYEELSRKIQSYDFIKVD
jgi:hypothetical protein